MPGGPAILPLLVLVITTVQAASVDPATLYAAGRCEEFSRAPLGCQSTMRGSWSSVWTAPSLGLSQERWEAQMYGPVVSTDTEYVAYLDVMSTLPYAKCAEAYARLICPTFFPPCVPNPDPLTNPVVQVLPVPVCRSVCLAVNDACREHQGGNDLLDCFNTTSPLTGALQWPEDSPSCTTAPVLGPDDSESADLVYSCPPPLVFEPDIPDQFSGLGCSSTCEEKLYILSSESQYMALYYEVTILSWVSWVLVLVLMVTIIIFEPLREFPTRIVLYICIGLFFGHMGPVGGSFIGTHYACKGDTELAYGVSYCGFYSWTLFFGGLVTIIFWAYQAFVIFYNVGMKGGRTKTGDERSEPWMVVFGFGYATVASIILSTVPPEGVGSSGTLPWCLSAAGQPKYHEDLVWALWIPPLIITSFLTTVFIGGSIFRLMMEGCRSSMRNRTLFRYFVVMAIFCIYFLEAVVAILAVQFNRQVKTPGWKSSISTWYSCVHSWRISTHSCPKGHVNYALNTWDSVSFTLCGTALFVCFFVLREKTWICWWQLIQNLREGRPAFEGITGISQTGTTSNR